MPWGLSTAAKTLSAGRLDIDEAQPCNGPNEQEEATGENNATSL